MSRSSFFRALAYLEIEEKILNVGALVALVGVFLPWFGGSWFGESTVWTGFGFYTSFVGLLIFVSLAFILSLTLLPLMGYQVIRKSVKDVIRLIVSLECVLLTIVTWSVLTNVTFDRAQMEVRFGIYLTLVGSIVASLYAFLRVQQQRKRQVQDLFHQSDAEEASPQASSRSRAEQSVPAPPPPPPPGEPEEPRLFSS